MSNQQKIRNAIIAATVERGEEKSTCPSEIARNLFPENWRSQMQAVRDVAYTLQTEGKVQVTQKGRPVDATAAKGPIRIKIARSLNR